jgi:hypothetical protein
MNEQPGGRVGARDERAARWPGRRTGRTSSPVSAGFVDLGVLSQIADLTCAAVTRLSRR